MALAGEDAYCTLLMSDSYLPGAAVLAHSLRDSGTTKKLAVLVTPDSLLHSTITELRKLYDYVLYAERIANPNLENLARLDRLDLRFAFTKIALWRQHQFRKLVYIDADVVALRAPDELFNIDAPLAAAPDIGWPDIFNSGVMMLKPSMGEFWSLQTLASSGTSFDGADQGLLNEHFANRQWHRISFTYNCTPSSSYQYEPAYRHFRNNISMVHFIGKNKPWNEGRQALTSSGSGVYKELLGRWWATYDRHYKISQSSAFGQVQADSRVVQQYVKDEQSNAAFGWAAQGISYPPKPEEHQLSKDIPPPPPNPTPAPPAPPPEAPAVSTEQPLMEPGEPAEIIEQAKTDQPFSPPINPWDATRFEPPTESQPEAAHFPTEQYGMSHDATLFHPPKAYPEPPKDMYYQVPENKPVPQDERPPPIFPWEQNQKKATRVFADDPPPSTDTRSAAEAEALSLKPTSVPSAPTIKVTPTDSFSSFSLKNAWDSVSSIEEYVRAMKEVQARRGKVQVLHQSQDSVTSPPQSSPSRQRRESLILTDFPTEIERPSLPVTPAPIHRMTFWGEDRGDEEQLPDAEGVPEQSQWNPIERLEQLRRSSLIATDELPNTERKELPLREVPGSSFQPGTSPPASTNAPTEPLLPSVLSETTGNGSGSTAARLAGSPIAADEAKADAGLAITIEDPAAKQSSQSSRRRDMSSLDEYSIA